MSSIIRVSGLTKLYGSLRAVDDLSFTVEKGSIYGFLGQNGAGKSTTIRMLLTLVTPTSGKIELFGMDLVHERQAILSQVGAIIEKPDLYKYLTGEENLSLFARMSGICLNDAQLNRHMERVGLAERAKSKVKTYSQGMKQRLGLAVSLVHDPQLLILDEPTNGLDPQGIADVRNLLLRLSHEEQKTIVISSHLLREIEVLADSMLILDKGKKVAEGPVKHLFDTSQMQVKCDLRNIGMVIESLKQSPWGMKIRMISGNTVFFKMDQQQIPQLLSDLISLKAEVTALQPVHSLEEYFLSLTTANQHVDAPAD
jgi:ABC-2 type transport system ATP-binding protein